MLKLKKIVNLSLLSMLLVSCNIDNPTINKSEIKNASEHEHNEIASNEPDAKVEFDTLNQGDNKAFKIQHFSFKRNKHPDIRIDDILLDSGESVMEEASKHPTGQIIPDFDNEKIINLTIKGKFKNREAFKLKNMLFTNEAGLLQQTVVEPEPKVRVVLDDSILFTPISVSETEMKVKIDTFRIPDLLLSGFHKISVIGGGFFTDTLIKVGKPETVTNKLTPTIDKVEILNDKKGKPVNIRITGNNYMLYPKFYHTTFDGVFGFGHETSLFEENEVIKYETIIHIPNASTFDKNKTHSLSFATPFGFAFKSF